MKSVPVLLASAVTPLVLGGCIAVAAGGIMAANLASKRNTRNDFLAMYHQANIDREKNGLEPLDWCSEVYRFDRGWARDLPECENRVAA